MGLQVEKLPLYEGATSVDCYANVRYLEQNKREDGKYTLNCIGMFSANNCPIQQKPLERVSVDVFNDDWAVGYELLKEYLDSIGVSWTDV